MNKVYRYKFLYQLQIVWNQFPMICDKSNLENSSNLQSVPEKIWITKSITLCNYLSYIKVKIEEVLKTIKLYSSSVSAKWNTLSYKHSHVIQDNENDDGKWINSLYTQNYCYYSVYPRKCIFQTSRSIRVWRS